VPVLAVSTTGAVAVESTVVFVTVVVSTVVGVVKFEESPLLVLFSVLLPQDAKVPAIAAIAKNFFMFLRLNRILTLNG
jgi:hypothetical protein